MVKKVLSMRDFEEGTRSEYLLYLADGMWAVDVLKFINLTASVIYHIAYIPH